MRKAQKQQITDFIQVLKQAHGEILKLIVNNSNTTAMDLLVQCQQGAIQIGTMIEQSEGEGFVTVTYLEQYCELTYQIHTKLAQNEAISVKEICDAIEQSVSVISESVENDIQIRKEVVFLPYKASMWDSLESIWQAADEDPECDAYVIPVPYYDKAPDGSFKDFHYEGDQYPDYVPITHYDHYDIAGRRPDMIFFHNPYDEHNYVTSVHPFFYAKNLKQYTDKLIYIPYFVLREVDPEDDEAIAGMEHFCQVAGVLHAHKVVVQSEDMRQVYIKVLVEKTGEKMRSYWEEKILGLGSPKFDKAVSTKREDVKIPEEWLKIIEKPDGTWKKIILYNTGVTAMIQKSEEMLTKIKDVFAFFKENQEEVALLWRPHPLLKETIASIHPRLREEYLQIVEAYREEKWGIYDDTAELDRAIALCDAYYGDGSSVVQLCQKAGKPVMIQNVEVLGMSEE